MSSRADRMSPARRTLLRWVLLCALCLLPNSLAVAQFDSDRAPARAAGNGLPLPPRANGRDAAAVSRTKSVANGSGMWTTVIALGAMVGVLTLAGRWLKPYLGTPRGLSIDALELLGRRVIEPKVSIHLVRCGSRILVLGVSPDGVRTLSEIADPDEVDRLTEACLNPNDSRSVAASGRTASLRDVPPAVSERISPASLGTSTSSKREAIHA